MWWAVPASHKAEQGESLETKNSELRVLCRLVVYTKWAAQCRPPRSGGLRGRLRRGELAHLGNGAAQSSLADQYGNTFPSYPQEALK